MLCCWMHYKFNIEKRIAHLINILLDFVLIHKILYLLILELKVVVEPNIINGMFFLNYLFLKFRFVDWRKGLQCYIIICKKSILFAQWGNFASYLWYGAARTDLPLLLYIVNLHVFITSHFLLYSVFLWHTLAFCVFVRCMLCVSSCLCVCVFGLSN
jgi:hypothetical protein